MQTYIEWVLALPLYMLFAAAALLACFSFARSSRRLMRLRAESRTEADHASTE